MKISRYSHIFKIDPQTTLVFNGITGGLLKLDKQASKIYDQISKGKTPVLNYKGAKSDFRILKEGNIIIEDDIDEYDYIRVLNNSMRFNPNFMNIILAPTLNCNFLCQYCFENKNKARMTSKVQKKTIDFIVKRLGSLKSLKIEWFGGEPLLEKKTIWDMSQRLMSLCKRYKCNYKASMISNGYLLDKKTALKLKECDVTKIQITLDGPKEVHDKRRMLHNGRGTFDKIIKNLADAADIIPLIALRINVDKKNIERVTELLDTLTELGLKNKIHVYYALVTSDTSACQDLSEDTFGVYDYLKLEVKLFKHNIQKGYNMAKYPQPAIGGCSAMRINSFVVDPLGDIYKCAKTIGIKDEKIGNVANPLQFNYNHLKWLSWDPLSFKICKSCTFFPICMGGCPYETLRKKLKEPDECSGWKSNIEEMLQLYYKSYLQRKTKQ